MVAAALFTLAFSAARTGCAHPAPEPQKEQSAMQSPITLQSKMEAGPDAIEISYRVTNGSAEPILLLDQLWNKQAKGFDPNWAYVEIRGSKALIKRVMETKPKGLAMDFPPVPYGRLIAPGATLEGKFAVPLPLTAANPYTYYVTPKAAPQPVQLTGLGFMLAWTTPPPEPVHPSMAKIEHDGMVLQPFTYYYLEGKQRFLTSEPKEIALPGVALVAPAP
jgi:hypothetical protein